MEMLRKGDWGLKLLSIAMAVVLWVYVTNELNPTKEKDFKNIPVDIRGLGQNLAASDLPESVNVRVSANQDVIGDLNAKSIETYIELGNVGPGEQEVPVKVKVPSGVTVTDLRPQRVKVKLEKMGEKQVPVVIKPLADPMEGYRVLSTEAIPNEVILRGPESALGQIKNAFVEVQMEDRQRSFSENIPIRLADTSGNNYEANLVTSNPQVVKVFSSIVPDLPTQNVQVMPKIEGKPAEGYAVSMTVVDPNTLQITGQQKLIEGITEVYTMPVDIEGAKQDVFKEVLPDLPAGVTGNRQTINVLVKISKK